MNYDTMLVKGTKRLTFSLPPNIMPPDVAIGTSVGIPIVNVRYTLKSASFNLSTRKYVVVIEVAEELKMSTAANKYITTVAPSLAINPYQPTVRTVGGYVKNPEPVYALERNEKFMDKIDRTINVVSPQGVVIAVPVVLGALATLLGLGIIYLTIESIEDIVDSPAVSMFLVAVAALILFILWKQLRT